MAARRAFDVLPPSKWTIWLCEGRTNPTFPWIHPAFEALILLWKVRAYVQPRAAKELWRHGRHRTRPGLNNNMTSWIPQDKDIQILTHHRGWPGAHISTPRCSLILSLETFRRVCMRSSARNHLAGWPIRKSAAYEVPHPAGFLLAAGLRRSTTRLTCVFRQACMKTLVLGLIFKMHSMGQLLVCESCV